MSLRLRLGSLLAVAGVLLSVATTIPVRALDCAPEDYVCQELLDAQNRQSSTADQLSVIQNQVKDTEKKMIALQSLIAQLNNQIAAQQVQINATQVQIDQLDGRIRLTEADVARRQAHLEVREQLFGRRVRAMDKHGSINYLALVLSSTNFNQLVDRLMIAQEIIHSDRQSISDLRVEKAHIEDLKVQLATQRAQEADLLTKQQGARTRMEGTRTQQQAALAYQQQLEAQFKAQADDLARQKAQIDGQVAALQALYDAQARQSGGGTGQFGWPETYHLISQRYGCSPYVFELYWPTCPSKHFHSGIDIAEPYGTPVLAADNGVATLSSSRGGYGNLLIITHGNGYSSIYGHLASFAVRSGQLVYRGQTVAFEGSTGNSTGPHLHFEIRYNTEYTDPCSYLGC